MKIRLEHDSQAPRTVLSFQPGICDGVPPITRLVVDRRLEFVDSDRLAIGSSLILKSFIADELDLDMPCSPEVAAAIEPIFAALYVRVKNVQQGTKAKPVSSGAAKLHVQCWADDAWNDAYPGLINLDFTPHDGACNCAAGSTLRLGTNIGLLCAGMGVAAKLGALGISILFAEDLNIGRILLPSGFADDVDGWDAITAAAHFSNIQLTMCEDPSTVGSMSGRC